MSMATTGSTTIRGRSLRGNVDRNIRYLTACASARVVVPYVGTWIEISGQSTKGGALLGRSLRGNVDRNRIVAVVHLPFGGSFPTWERG